MELVDILDLKSGGQKPCGFDSRLAHQIWWSFTTKFEPNSSGATKLRPDACARTARPRPDITKNSLIIFFEVPPAEFV